MSGGGGGDGPGCPLWIISFADMISNLVIFFILVATYASKNTDADSMPRKVLDKQVGVFGTGKERVYPEMVPRQGRTSPGEDGPAHASQRRGAEAEKLRTLVQDKAYHVKPRVSALADGVRIAFEESGMFVAGSGQLSGEARDLVAEVGRFYRSEPVDLVIEAHTDDRSFRFSQSASDVDLTRVMAIAVAVVLTRDAGVEAPRVGISPFGADRPVEPNTTAAGRAKNRRVEIVIKERT